MPTPVTAVTGIGPGNGAAFARRFAAEGHKVALLARSATHTGPLAAELAGSAAFACDVTDPASISSAFTGIRETLGPVDTLIYNAGGAAWGSIEEATLADFDNAWQVNARGLMLATQAVLPDMKARGSGNIIVVGATASLRGGARFAAFASAKAAQRSLAQSMARQLWPQGIHVALLILDGPVWGERMRALMPNKPQDAFLSPEAIANTALAVTQQPRSAWSFEVEQRPSAETW